MTTLVIQADTGRLPLASGSVDLIVTSPPYYGHRDYTLDDRQLGAEVTPIMYVDNLVAYTREWTRVLKSAGSIWVNLGDTYASYPGGRGDGRIDKNGPRQVYATGHGLLGGGVVKNKSLMGTPWRYALRCIDDLGLILRAEVIWDKTNGKPESVKDRVWRVHETWFHFTIKDRYYATNKTRGATERFLHRSVWRLPVASGHVDIPDGIPVRHYARFPKALPAMIVPEWSPLGGVVLDPFGGTGTTALVASECGRLGISVDLSPDYGRLARHRLRDREITTICA